MADTLAAKVCETLGITLVEVYTEALLNAQSGGRNTKRTLKNVTAEAPLFSALANTLLGMDT